MLLEGASDFELRGGSSRMRPVPAALDPTTKILTSTNQGAENAEETKIQQNQQRSQGLEIAVSVNPVSPVHPF